MEIAPDWLTGESEKTNWLTLLISRPKGGMTRQNIILILFFFLRRAISPFFQTCCLIPGDRVALSSHPFCWLNYRPFILEWVVTRFPWHRVFFRGSKPLCPKWKERESPLITGQSILLDMGQRSRDDRNFKVSLTFLTFCVSFSHIFHTRNNVFLVGNVKYRKGNLAERVGLLSTMVVLSWLLVANELNCICKWSRSFA